MFLCWTVLSSSLLLRSFAEVFSENSNLDKSGDCLISLPELKWIWLISLLLSRWPRKSLLLLILPVHLVLSIFQYLLTLENSVPEILHLLVDLYNACLKEPCFADCWKVSFVAPVLKTVGERSLSSVHCPVSILSFVNKIYEKLVNDKIVEHFKRCCVFCDIQYCFKSS